MNTGTSFRFDFSLLAATILLTGIGIAFIYSSGVTSTGEVYSTEYIKQIIWALLGLITLFTVSLVDYNRFKGWALRIYLANFILLLLTLFFGKVVNGSKSWLGIWELGIQPSEFMKVSTILYLASFLERYSYRMLSWTGFFLSLGIVLLPMGLILLQPDFGTAMVFIPIFFFMVFTAGAKLEYILFFLSMGTLSILFTILPVYGTLLAKRAPTFFVRLGDPDIVTILLAGFIGIALLSFLGLWITKRRYLYWSGYVGLVLSGSLIASLVFRKFLKSYQLMRLMVFLNPTIDPKGAGWNIIQSITAVGSGGFWGKGFLQGPHSHFRYIPQQSTDFIFSIIAEELGFIGSAFVILLFGVLLFRGLRIMGLTKDPFVRYASSGICGMIFFHVAINIGMAMGIMPITGIPLFFLSYGGSSLITVMICVGLLSNFYLRRYKY
ncbi:MAG: rod shape-determining protein RodA [Spirochaetes bacterium]|nr:rod shape-determining protein RodA [Spirochaetota bacterium]